MALRELSFKSAEPIPSIPYQRYQIRLLSGVSLEAKEKELGKIAFNLKILPSDTTLFYSNQKNQENLL
ncbi:UNVERIFIED_CONTAM: hypothetical protein BEN50_16415 [Euhalothece sp. KZN 001]